MSNWCHEVKINYGCSFNCSGVEKLGYEVLCNKHTQYWTQNILVEGLPGNTLSIFGRW